MAGVVGIDQRLKRKGEAACGRIARFRRRAAKHKRSKALNSLSSPQSSRERRVALPVNTGDLQGNALRQARGERRREREKDATTRLNKKPGSLAAIDLGLTRHLH